jgi:DNA processing protein
MLSYSKEQADLIVADSFAQLNYKEKKLLLAGHNQNVADREKYEQALIKSVGSGVYNIVKADFCDQKYRNGVLSKLESKGITCITIKSQQFPDYLSNIPVPPLVLYCKGNLSLLSTQCFGMVGSRRTLPAMLTQAKGVAGQLTQNFTLVTGVADGADSAVIEGALPSGKLICVLPNGFDYLYPASNASLIKKVEEKGLLITELPPETAPQKYLFSMRNRVIAGLTKGVLVVSAAEKSGALITANYAVDFGREVFAFPYSIGVTSGVGCNGLIKKGAGLVESATDVFEAFGLDAEVKKTVELSGDELKLYNYLKDNGEQHLQQITAFMNKRAFEVVCICSALEIKGLVVKTGGNKYSAVG